MNAILRWFRSSISRQIGLVSCFAAVLVMAITLTLIWYLSSEWLPIRAIYLLALYALAVVCLIPLGVTYLVRRFLRRPLGALTEGLRRAEEGDFLYRVNVRSKNEVGQLAENFNRMMSKVTDLMAMQMDTERQLNQTQAKLELKSEISRQAEVIRKTNEELQARIKYLSLLYDIGNSISSIVEPEQLYTSLVRVICDQLGFDQFAIYILDPQTDILTMRASRGFPEEPEIRMVQFHLGEGITGIVAQTGKTQLIRDTRQDPRYLHYKGLHERDGSFLCVPLKVKGSVLGVFSLFRPQRNAFSAHEIRLLIAVANQAAIAIENAQLFNNTRQLSVTDELTGLANRRHFRAMLELEKKRSARFGKPMSIAMIDVDNFKRFNDTFGHLRGDEVLKRVAHLLRENVREVDLVARFGGEEFIVLLTNATGREAFLIADKLRERIEKEQIVAGEGPQRQQVTVSVGCACCPEDTEDIDDLENIADVALYAAKRAGKNQVIRYSSQIAEKPLEVH